MSKILANKLAVITGGNRGIGLSTAAALVQQGANVVLACRNKDAGMAAISRTLARNIESKDQIVESRHLDLASFESVHEFSKSLVESHGKSPDILINNAGILLKDRSVTQDGNETTLQVNFLSPTLLSLLLLKGHDKVQKSNLNTILNLSAGVHRSVETNLEDLQFENGYDGWKAYCHSKRLQLMFHYFLSNLASSADFKSDSSLSFLSNQREFKSICVDPGWVKTSLVRPEHGWNTQDIEKKMGGASSAADTAVETILKALTDDSVKSGYLLMRGKPVKPGKGVEDELEQEQLWNITKHLVKW